LNNIEKPDSKMDQSLRVDFYNCVGCDTHYVGCLSIFRHHYTWAVWDIRAASCSLALLLGELWSYKG